MKSLKKFFGAKPIEPQQLEDISSEFLEYILQENLKENKVKGYWITPLNPGLVSSIQGKVVRIYIDKYQGQPVSLILKVNSNDEVVHQELIKLARHNKEYQLASLIPNLKFNFREAMAYKNLDQKYSDFMPHLYFQIMNEKKNQIWLFLEDLKECELYDKWDDLNSWDDFHVDCAIKCLARFHSQAWNDRKLQQKKWLLNSDPPGWRDFIKQSLVTNLNIHPSFFDTTRIVFLQEAINNLDLIFQELRMQYYTLIHGDCTPRNICFKPSESGLNLKLYDWSLVSYHPPQFDLAKLLLFLYDPYKDLKRIHAFVEAYFRYLPPGIQATIEESDFYRGFELACIHYSLVHLTVTAQYDETEGLKWLFRELENRLRFIEQLGNV